MAVERTGTAVTISTSSDSSSQSITVPADATLAVIFLGGASGTDSAFSSGGATFSIGGSSSTWRARSTNAQDDGDTCAHTVSNPATGTQTFAWTIPTGVSYGHMMVIVFYKGVDTTNPIRSSGGNNSDNSSVTLTVSGLSYSTGDMMVGAACAVGTFTVTDNSQSQIALIGPDAKQSVAYFGVADKANTGTFSISNATYPGSVALVLAAAGSSSPVILKYYARKDWVTTSWATISGSASFSVTAGSLLIAFTNYWDGGVTPNVPADSAGTFTLLSGASVDFEAQGHPWTYCEQLIYVQPNAAGGTHTITPPANVTDSSMDAILVVVEIPNAESSPTYRALTVYKNWSAGGGTYISSPIATTSGGTNPVTGDLMFAMVGLEDDASNPNLPDTNYTLGSPWTVIAQYQQGYNLPTVLAYQVLSSDGAVSISVPFNDPYVMQTWVSMFAVGAAGASTLNQHSFRFFNDDGSESAATTKAALNTNINLSANDVARLRFLIDATGDPAGKQFQLEYRKKPSGGSFGPWTEVT